MASYECRYSAAVEFGCQRSRFPGDGPRALQLRTNRYRRNSVRHVAAHRVMRPCKDGFSLYGAPFLFEETVARVFLFCNAQKREAFDSLPFVTKSFITLVFRKHRALISSIIARCKTTHF